jgi:hypothetical protein
MISLTTDRTNGGGYRPIQTVISDESLREVAIRDAIRFLRTAYSKYEYLSELSGIGKELELLEARYGPSVAKSRQQSGAEQAEQRVA